MLPRRIRAALGLKPLKEGKSSAAAKNQEVRRSFHTAVSWRCLEYDSGQLGQRSIGREKAAQNPIWRLPSPFERVTVACST